MRIDRLAGTLLLILGILTIGSGVYLLTVRPVMLPEDVRFTGVRPEQLTPAMAAWLGIVFRTWGGFVAGFGITIVGVAAYMFTSRFWLIAWSVAVGILVAFGRFLASNLTLRSDFLWFISVMFTIAVFAALRLCLRHGSRRGH